MSNDPRDDAMREIEAALDAHEDRVGTWATSDRCFPRKGRAKLLALIRSKLPQPRSLLEGHGIGAGIDHRDPGAWGEDDDRHRANEEHERAVEAWRDRVKSKFSAAYLLIENGDLADAVYECLKGEEVVDEALRLMRARPASDHPAPQMHGRVAVYVNPDDGSWARPASDWERRFYALADKVKCRAPSCGDIDCGLGEIDDKLQAAGELLRAAKALLDESDIIQCDNPDVIPRFLDAIAKAERAGIKP